MPIGYPITKHILVLLYDACGIDHSLYTVSLLKLSTSSMKSHKHDAYFQFTLGSLKPREFPFEFINRFHLNKGCYGMLHTPLKCNLVNFDIPNGFS